VEGFFVIEKLAALCFNLRTASENQKPRRTAICESSIRKIGEIKDTVTWAVFTHGQKKNVHSEHNK
jgi:hypothetical protein